jgi:hypothetical protein
MVLASPKGGRPRGCSSTLVQSRSQTAPKRGPLRIPGRAARRALMTKAAARPTSAARSHLHAGQRLSSRKRRDGGAIRPGGRPVHPADR